MDLLLRGVREGFNWGDFIMALEDDMATFESQTDALSENKTPDEFFCGYGFGGY